MIFKELVLEADDQNRWLARLMGKGDKERPSSDPEEEGDLLAALEQATNPER
jgi:hypothetical protein